METDVAYVNDLGVIHWKTQKMGELLVPVQTIKPLNFYF